ncbi:MAG: hypothetical protein K0S30_112 [Clostridia bacterium]|jgi:hypothetical protein|nr:hypothetical protein [Clostridia bacterium]
MRGMKDLISFLKKWFKDSYSDNSLLSLFIWADALLVFELLMPFMEASLAYVTKYSFLFLLIYPTILLKKLLKNDEIRKYLLALLIGIFVIIISLINF